MDPSPTLQSKSELFWYCQSSALASQIVTLRSNFAVWQDTRGVVTRCKRFSRGLKSSMQNLH
eukprot:scaffold25769_cov45-Phaeocystis_antarctica.AAC.1